MVSESIPKKKRKWVLIVLLLLLGLLAACYINSTQSRNYPFLVTSTWQCSDPHFTLIYNAEGRGKFTSYEELEWNNQTIQVEIGFLMHEYDVFPVGATAYSDRLFSGTWRYRNGTLVFFIKEDYIFGKQYDELVFHKQE